MNQSIFPTKIYDGVPLRLVPHAPDNGYLFYVSDDGKIGLRIAPNGVETVLNAINTTCENCKILSDANRLQRYLHFAHPWNSNEQILVSHAVYRAWVGPFSEPCIDHKNGVTTDNRWQNLSPVTYAENNRRAYVLKRLRAAGIDPAALPFHELDRHLGISPTTSLASLREQ